MPDAIGNKTAHDYHLDVPAPEQGFFAKGLGHGDWGAKNRLSHLFNPKSGNTVMLAFDHGYIMGATAGLERMDVTIAPLCRYADVLMATRGAIRACIPPTVLNAICLRATHAASVLIDDMSTGNGVGADMEDAIRMNASAVAISAASAGRARPGPWRPYAAPWTPGNGTASLFWASPPWARRWPAPPSISCWPPGCWQSWGRPSSRPTTAMTLRR